MWLIGAAAQTGRAVHVGSDRKPLAHDRLHPINPDGITISPTRKARPESLHPRGGIIVVGEGFHRRRSMRQEVSATKSCSVRRNRSLRRQFKGGDCRSAPRFLKARQVPSIIHQPSFEAGQTMPEVGVYRDESFVILRRRSDPLCRVQLTRISVGTTPSMYSIKYDLPCLGRECLVYVQCSEKDTTPKLGN
jgi:hypothetical protein